MYLIKFNLNTAFKEKLILHDKDSKKEQSLNRDD